jgi:hypothetical protein
MQYAGQHCFVPADPNVYMDCGILKASLAGLAASSKGQRQASKAH